MIKNVYIHLVLFITLMMTIGGSLGVFASIADIVAPAPFHLTVGDFIDESLNPSMYDLSGIQRWAFSGTTPQERHQAAAEAYKARQIAWAKNQLIYSLGWIAVSLPVFIYFLRQLADKKA